MKRVVHFFSPYNRTTRYISRELYAEFRSTTLSRQLQQVLGSYYDK